VRSSGGAWCWIYLPEEDIVASWRVWRRKETTGERERRMEVDECLKAFVVKQ